MTRTRPLVAVLALPLLLAAPLAPALAAGLTPEQAAAEQKACMQRAKGSGIDKPKRACTCMVEGLSESLSEADYAALALLLDGGAATPEGEAAHATARQLVEQCLAG